MEIIECKTPLAHMAGFAPLLAAHWEELTTIKEAMPFDPDLGRYEEAQKTGLLLCYLLMDGERIAGYSVSFFYNPLHWSRTLICHNDILYVSPEFRNTSWGVRLIKRTEEGARERGAKLVFFHGKENTAFTHVMPRMGYQVQDVVFVKKV